MARTSRPQLAKSPVIDEMPIACADEQAAREFLEKKRWGDAPCCPHCGSIDVYRMVGPTSIARGLLRCKDCKKQFTVRVGTIMEESLIPLHKWCRAYWEAATCKNGVSALELSRKIQISYKSALFMLNRIRFAMESGPDIPKLSGIVEADETYVGGKPRYPYMKNGKVRKGPNPNKPKTPVFAVVERGGKVRARVMPSVTADNIRQALTECVELSAKLMTDDHKLYTKVGRPFASHDTVKHSEKEYVNKDNPEIHSNTIENVFSRIKRQINGTYHAVSPEHLHRYVAQAEWLYNARGINDGDRSVNLIQESQGKRLMYKTPA